MTKRSRIKRDERGGKIIEGRKNKSRSKNRNIQCSTDDSDLYIQPVNDSHLERVYRPPRCKQPLQPKTKSQQRYMNAIRQHCLTFGIGPAGTGKSYVAAGIAADMLAAGEIERIDDADSPLVGVLDRNAS